MHMRNKKNRQVSQGYFSKQEWPKPPVDNDDEGQAVQDFSPGKKVPGPPSQGQSSGPRKKAMTDEEELSAMNHGQAYADDTCEEELEHDNVLEEDTLPEQEFIPGSAVGNPDDPYAWPGVKEALETPPPKGSGITMPETCKLAPKNEKPERKFNYDLESDPNEDYALTAPIRSAFFMSQELDGLYKNKNGAKVFLGKYSGTIDLYRMMRSADPGKFRNLLQHVLSGQICENLAISQALSLKIYQSLDEAPEKLKGALDMKLSCDAHARAAMELGLQLTSLPRKLPQSQSVKINVAGQQILNGGGNSSPSEVYQKTEDPNVR